MEKSGGKSFGGFPGERELRLESWKEIAAYLKKDLRTVQRWERREGLPVHRHLHDRISSVYAFKSEIDEWQSQRRPNLAFRQRISGRRWAAAAAVLAVLILAYIYVLPRRQPNRPARLAYDGSRLVTKGSDDSVLWTVPLANLLTDPVPGFIADLDGDGRDEVLASTMFSAGPTTPPVFRNSEVHCFSMTGEPLWSFSLNDTLLFGTKEFGPPWAASYWLFNGGASRPIIGIALHHLTWWPSVLVLLNGRGQVVGKFTNSGWLETVHWLPRPTGSLILAGGISNSRDSAILAVLDPEHSSGSSPEDSGSEYECKNCENGKPVRYFVFPRSELNSVMAPQHHHTVLMVSSFHDRFTVHTTEVAGRLAGTTENIDAIYEFSLDLQLTGASYSDRYWELHRRLESEGKIHHSAVRCPELRGPGSVRSWDPINGWLDLDAQNRSEPR